MSCWVFTQVFVPAKAEEARAKATQWVEEGSWEAAAAQAALALAQGHPAVWELACMRGACLMRCGHAQKAEVRLRYVALRQQRLLLHHGHACQLTMQFGHTDTWLSSSSFFCFSTGGIQHRNRGQRVTQCAVAEPRCVFTPSVLPGGHAAAFRF